MALQIKIFRKRDKSEVTISFGYETPIWSSVYWMDITREYRDSDNNVEYAEMLFSFLPQKRFRKSNKLLWWKG